MPQAQVSAVLKAAQKNESDGNRHTSSVCVEGRKGGRGTLFEFEVIIWGKDQSKKLAQTDSSRTASSLSEPDHDSFAL